MTYEYEIYHHGIKGMKWGVRRKTAKSGKNSSFASRFKSKPKPQKQISSQKKLSEMSDEELRTRLARFDMEKRYKQYMAEMNPKKHARLKKFVLDSIENGAKSFVNKAFERLANNLLTKSETDEKTNISIKDPYKLGDKAFEKYLKRKNSEEALKRILANSSGTS